MPYTLHKEMVRSKRTCECRKRGVDPCQCSVCNYIIVLKFCDPLQTESDSYVVTPNADLEGVHITDDILDCDCRVFVIGDVAGSACSTLVSDLETTYGAECIKIVQTILFNNFATLANSGTSSVTVTPAVGITVQGLSYVIHKTCYEPMRCCLFASGDATDGTPTISWVSYCCDCQSCAYVMTLKVCGESLGTITITADSDYITEAYSGPVVLKEFEDSVEGSGCRLYRIGTVGTSGTCVDVAVDEVESGRFVPVGPWDAYVYQRSCGELSLTLSSTTGSIEEATWTIYEACEISGDPNHLNCCKLLSGSGTELTLDVPCCPCLQLCEVCRGGQYADTWTLTVTSRTTTPATDDPCGTGDTYVDPYPTGSAEVDGLLGTFTLTKIKNCPYWQSPPDPVSPTRATWTLYIDFDPTISFQIAYFSAYALIRHDWTCGGTNEADPDPCLPTGRPFLTHGGEFGDHCTVHAVPLVEAWDCVTGIPTATTGVGCLTFIISCSDISPGVTTDPRMWFKLEPGDTVTCDDRIDDNPVPLMARPMTAQRLALPIAPRDRCAYLGDRTETRKNCNGYMCKHDCDHRLNAEHPIAIPGGNCQTCPHWKAVGSGVLEDFAD